jgi:hypothetical protein
VSHAAELSERRLELVSVLLPLPWLELVSVLLPLPWLELVSVLGIGHWGVLRSGCSHYLALALAAALP